MMKTADFDYFLPPELIAQQPVPQRDQSRLLVLERKSGKIQHRKFADLVSFFRPGDVLVLNNSKVIPARLRGRNAQTGGQFELLLLKENALNDWWAMLRPGKRAKIDSQIQLLNLSKQPTNILATVLDINAEGHRRLHFSGVENIFSELAALGEIPLPPYIARAQTQPEDSQRYQTVYAQNAGSVAAPTAGLHFTPDLLLEIEKRGVKICPVTLHVGLGTFAPVKTETLAGHVMHEEHFFVSAETAGEINAAKRENRRVIAVGTTSVRVLETLAKSDNKKISSGPGQTRIFIFPPYDFFIVDALITNFHLPCSTLLMLISALATPGETHGREMVLSAYAAAIHERYRFFSYGDAMLIL